MAEAVALDLVDQESVALTLDDGDQIALGFTEEVIAFQVTGETGARGPRGYTSTITVGEITTGTAGTDAVVINVGDEHDAIFDFTIPEGIQGIQGEDGTAATITVGDVTTGTPGSPAAVTNTGTTLDAILDFEIPQGDKGDAATVTVGDVDTGAPGSAAQVLNVGTTSDAVFDFVIPQGPVGPQGPPGLDTGFYRHNQGGPSTQWTVAHNLGFRPAVTVVDSAEEVIFPDVVTYLDDNTVQIDFSVPVGGYAYCS
jgi:hypothetical protein